MDDIFKGETHDYGVYIEDENGNKEDPRAGVNYNDVIIFLYMDYNTELVQCYSVTGTPFTRNNIEYSPVQLTIPDGTNDMEFTIQSADTQGKGTGNIIIQIDTIKLDDTTITKYKGVLGKVLQAL